MDSQIKYPQPENCFLFHDKKPQDHICKYTIHFYRFIYMLRLLNFPLMVIFIVFFITNIKVEITRVRLNETRFSLTQIIRNITTGLFGLDSALKKVIPIYLGPKKKLSPIYLGPKNLDTILMHWMSMKLSELWAFMAVPVSIDGKSILTLYNSTLQKVHKSK